MPGKRPSVCLICSKTATAFSSCNLNRSYGKSNLGKLRGAAALGCPVEQIASPADFSEFQVKSESGGQHRAAVAIVAGMVDVLEIQAGENPAPQVRVVIALDNIFSTVIQCAVAKEKPRSAKGQVVLVVGRNTI